MTRHMFLSEAEDSKTETWYKDAPGCCEHPHEILDPQP